QLLALAGTELPLAGRVGGALRLKGEPGDEATWNGSGTLVAAGTDGPRAVGVSGEGSFAIENGVLSARAPDLVAAATRFAATLSLDLRASRRIGDLTLDGHTTAIDETRAAAVLLAGATGVALPDVLLRPVSGSGDLHARLGIGRGPDLELTLGLGQGAWNGT